MSTRITEKVTDTNVTLSPRIMSM